MKFFSVKYTLVVHISEESPTSRFQQNMHLVVLGNQEERAGLGMRNNGYVVYEFVHSAVQQQ